MIRLPSYLQLSPHHIYYFRMAVPDTLRPLLGRREIKISLKTRNRQRAIIQARYLAYRVGTLFDVLKDKTVAEKKNENPNEWQLITIGQIGKDLSNVTIDYGGDTEKELGALQKILSTLPADTNASIEKKINKAGISLTEAIEEYCNKKSSQDKWTEKTLLENKAAFQTLLEILSDCDIGILTHKDGDKVLAELKNYPKNRNVSPRFKNKTLADIQANLSDKDKLSTPTINKLLLRYKALCDWCQQVGYIERNPFAGTSIKDREKAQAKRTSLSDADIEKLFDTALFKRHEFKYSWQYWIPLLGLYTGARLEELCQLHTKDIEEIEGSYFLKISDDTPDKQVKSTGSNRLVPIHPHLTDLGFLKFVTKGIQSEEPRLFPEIKKVKGRYGHTVSRWFGEYRKSVGPEFYSAKPKKDFHSFRDTIADKLISTGIAQNIVERLLGHTPQKTMIGNDYGGQLPANTLASAIEKIDFRKQLKCVKPLK